MSRVNESKNSNQPIDDLVGSKIKAPVNKFGVINAGKQVTIPDVGDRTLNDPCYLMSSNDTLKLANQNRQTNLDFALNNFSAIKLGSLEKKHLNSQLFKNIISEAKALGWGDVRLVGKQLLFVAPFINNIFIDTEPKQPESDVGTSR